MAAIDTILNSRISTPALNRWCKGFTATKKFVDDMEVPLIGIWSNVDCSHCEKLERGLVQATFTSWMATSQCVFYFGYGADTSADDKYEGRGYYWCWGPDQTTSVFPFVRVYWKKGNVDWIGNGDKLDNFKDKAEGAREIVKKLSSILKNFDPSSVNKDDIKLLSGKNNCTSQTDSDMTTADDVAMKSKRLGNQLFTMYSGASGPEGYNFSGWSSHSNTGQTTGPAFGLKTAFADVKSLAETNGRPMFIIYGKAHNKGSCAFNGSFTLWERAGNHTLVEFGKCQMDNSFDPSLQKGNFGFYFVYYFNDKDETCAEANEVKQFITQFGSIPTGYPWYCAYCKHADGSIYARYGSLPSVNLVSTDQKNQEEISPIYTDFGDFARKIGQEIQYTWTGSQEEVITNQTFRISFDLNGGIGHLQPLDVVTASNESFVGSVVLPSRSQVEATVKKDGFKPFSFIDASENAYKFGSELAVDGNQTLSIVWAKVEKNESSEHQKPSAKRGQIRSYTASQFPVWYKYKSTGYKTSQFSSNISALQVIGEASGGPARNSASQQLVEAYFNDNISEVAPSAFMDCQNLAYVGAKSIKSVGDYAFYNCKSLTTADFIGAQNKALTRIGDYAFAGSGIKDLVINLQGSVSDSSTNSHCFANCRELTSVNITNSTYLADHMFDGCTKLQQVTLNNYHSYINNYAFANCTMLTSMTLPQKTYMLPDHFFDGCTNLREVKFDEPSDLKYLGSSVFANCPKLTSITLPKSVDSLEYIDPLFLQGSSVDRIVFKGVADDQFADVIEKTVNTKYNTGVFYERNADVLKNAYEVGVPVFAYYTNGAGSCGNCNTWKSNVTSKAEFDDWVSSQNFYFVRYVANTNDEVQTVGHQFTRDVQNNMKFNISSLRAFPFVVLFWRDIDYDTQTVVKTVKESYDYVATEPKTRGISALKATVRAAFDGWHGVTTEEVVIKEMLTTFGRGEDAAVTFVSSTGKEYVCKNDSIVYTPETRVDHYSTSNFKYGIWYGNIKQLRAFADENHLPLLLEFGSRGCDPCKDFKKNTFNNQDFQEQIAQKPCLLAKVEIGDGQSFDYPTDTQEFYASHEIGDPKTYIPQLVYYWHKEDGTTYKEIWNYNYRSDPGNANYQTVLNKLDCMLGSYAGDPQYVAPPIESQLDGKYRYYQSESGDDHGQFFICDKKTTITNFSEPGTKLSIVLEQSTQTAGVTLVLDSIGIGDELVLDTLSAADGAYQYFTVGESSKYFDLSGVVFTVHDSTVDNLLRFENEIGTTYSSDYEHTDAGQWMTFNDTSTRESFEAKLDVYQSSSTPMLIYERPPTVGAIAVFAPRSSGEEQTQTIQIDIENAKSQNDIEAKVREAIGPDNTLQSISNIDDLVKLQTFNTQVKHNAAFLTWAKKNNLVLLDAASSSWSSGAPARIRQFESEVQFHGNSTSDPLPKMLLYHGCSTCTVDGSTLVYTRQKIVVDSTKQLSYYTTLIKSYLEELEQ